MFCQTSTIFRQNVGYARNFDSHGPGANFNSLDLRDISNTWHFTERRKTALKICTFKPRFFKLLNDLPFQPIAQNLHIYMHFNIFKRKHALLYWYWWENYRKCQTFDPSWKLIVLTVPNLTFGASFTTLYLGT